MAEPKRVFIGHGRSLLWRQLKDFLVDRLNLPYEEFNREAMAGISTTDRLKDMLDNACFALLVMTVEDRHADGSGHARENVVHEVGLFQGRLGFNRAIVLIEEGCTEFSNLHGLTQLRFPTGNIIACSEEIRRVLEREGILARHPSDTPLPVKRGSGAAAAAAGANISTGAITGSNVSIHVGNRQEDE